MTDSPRSPQSWTLPLVREDSNLRPAGYEPDALSSELRTRVFDSLKFSAGFIELGFSPVAQIHRSPGRSRIISAAETSTNRPELPEPAAGRTPGTPSLGSGAESPPIPGSNRQRNDWRTRSVLGSPSALPENGGWLARRSDRPLQPCRCISSKEPLAPILPHSHCREERPCCAA
jgi:hypothetical protein